MKTGLKIRVCAALLVLTPGHGVHGQTAYAAQTLVSSGVLPAQAEIVREIDDPYTGERWLLTRDPIHPAGPGHLVPVGGMRIATSRSGEPLAVLPRPIIRAGDRLVVEENTAVVEARLEAVALGPALVGSPLDVRLTIGGKGIVNDFTYRQNPVVRFLEKMLVF